MPVSVPYPSVAAHSILNPNLNAALDNITQSQPQIHPDLAHDESHEQTTSTEPKTLSPRHQKLLTSIQNLEAQVTIKQAELSSKLAQLRDHPSFQAQLSTSSVVSPASAASSPIPDLSDKAIIQQAHAIVKKHIKLLHRYNEIKDVGLGLMGLIAEKEGKRLAEVMEERGINDKD